MKRVKEWTPSVLVAAEKHVTRYFKALTEEELLQNALQASD